MPKAIQKADFPSPSQICEATKGNRKWLQTVSSSFEHSKEKSWHLPAICQLKFKLAYKYKSLLFLY